MTNPQSTTSFGRGEIRAWVEEHDGTEGGAEPGVLRIDFASGRDDPSVSSEERFERLERSPLAFLDGRSKAAAEDGTPFKLVARD
jgi:hypothetical protein